MNKALFGIFFIFVISLLLAGCTKEKAPADGGQQNIPEGETANDTSDISGTSDSSDTYVDEQILDENESVEIGEMI